MPRRGVTVGKFYPPHRGHQRLIAAARSRCDDLTVIVGSRPGEDPPASLRLGWLRELFPNVRFLLVDDVYPEQPDVWAKVAVRLLGSVPDVAFAGEEYGAAWARHMGCEFELIDRTAGDAACSGTAVRADPLGHWDCLDAPVRAYYVARIVVVGAESTGTTTLSRALAGHYQTAWVREYGREYYEARLRRGDGSAPWETNEFVAIATEQARLEDQAAREADRVLLCDTDPFATEIWHERYVGAPSDAVAAISRDRRYALYLLTGTDIPFQQDGFRDGEKIRDWMHRRFAHELEARGKHYLLVEGGPETRLRTAIAKIDEVIGLSRLYRPVGPEGLDLIRDRNRSGYPARLASQPIFYPVLNFEYAERIARDWNVRDSGYGAVTTCWVRRAFLDRYEVRQVGGPTALEYWIPSGELDAFNANIVGRIQVVREYRSRPGCEST